jgi:hypothetical protein
MTFGLQDLSALAIVAAAGVYLARGAWQQFAVGQAAGGCSSCGGCSSKSAQGRQVVPLTLKTPR